MTKSVIKIMVTISSGGEVVVTFGLLSTDQ